MDALDKLDDESSVEEDRVRFHGGEDALDRLSSSQAGTPTANDEALDNFDSDGDSMPSL